mmetsp:Transcript_29866/g.54892  ORF Transcript_29866/g.54892 Transcript_29866/m.54892 type:complete len:204 (-) Transcript_29866:1898-2509(-)
MLLTLSFSSNTRLSRSYCSSFASLAAVSTSLRAFSSADRRLSSSIFSLRSFSSVFLAAAAAANAAIFIVPAFNLAFSSFRFCSANSCSRIVFSSANRRASSSSCRCLARARSRSAFSSANRRASSCLCFSSFLRAAAAANAAIFISPPAGRDIEVTGVTANLDGGGDSSTSAKGWLSSSFFRAAAAARAAIFIGPAEGTEKGG